MAQVRLHKFLAECGMGSRRAMEKYIVDGRVGVNGKIVKDLGIKIDPEQDRIEVDHRPVKVAHKGIVLFNKPRGVVSTVSDPEGRPTITDYLSKKFKAYYPVGRLDWDSTGLIVCTNDGELADRLMHPRYGWKRVYHARVEGSVSEGTIEKLGRGVRLSDGPAKAEVEILSSDQKSTWVEVTVEEGRNRLVRRLFDRVEHPVIKLKRVAHGPFKIGKMEPGDIRPLTEKEYGEMRRKVLGSVQERVRTPRKSPSTKGRPPTKAQAGARKPIKKRKRPGRTRWTGA